MKYLKLCLINGEEGKKGKKLIRRPAGVDPDANGRADKNGHFSVRSATQTDGVGHKNASRRWRCPYWLTIGRNGSNPLDLNEFWVNK
jgi:hypothetical protein